MACIVAMLSFAITGCASLAPTALAPVNPGFGTPVNRITSDSGECRDLMAINALLPVAELSAEHIRLMSWNVHKGSRRGWQQDFDQFAANQDLVLLQEASENSQPVADGGEPRYWSFAQGYNPPMGATGVMTLSASRSLTQCHFTEQEPWLRTVKATNITQYGLTATEQTLAVVNIHAINFTLGLGALNKQLSQIAEVIGDHQGPVILSGDLNTWRAGRQEVVDEFARGLGLRSLSFNDDKRSTFFGKQVDHVYVRGLRALETEIPVVKSSDHNPILVTLSVT